MDSLTMLSGITLKQLLLFPKLSNCLTSVPIYVITLLSECLINGPYPVQYEVDSLNRFFIFIPIDNKNTDQNKNLNSKTSDDWVSPSEKLWLWIKVLENPATW